MSGDILKNGNEREGHPPVVQGLRLPVLPMQGPGFNLPGNYILAKLHGIAKR